MSGYDTKSIDIAERKAAARKHAFGVRKAAHGATDAGRAQSRLHAHLSALACVDIISGYMPIRTEIDPIPVMRALIDEGFTMCVPIVEGKGTPTSFPGMDAAIRDWKRAHSVPLFRKTGAWLEPDALIVPLLSFDTAGYRLGYGGGFYDRTLATLGGRRRVYSVGFAYEAQRCDVVPRQENDMQLDAIVTEQATH